MYFEATHIRTKRVKSKLKSEKDNDHTFYIEPEVGVTDSAHVKPFG